MMLPICTENMGEHCPNWNIEEIEKPTELRKSAPQFPFSQQSLCNVSNSPKRPDTCIVSFGQ